MVVVFNVIGTIYDVIILIFLKNLYFKKGSRSRDSYIFCIFLRQSITLPSFIIVAYVWQILERGPSWTSHLLAAPKRPTWIGLSNKSVSRVQVGCQSVLLVIHTENKSKTELSWFSHIEITHFLIRLLFRNNMLNVYALPHPQCYVFDFNQELTILNFCKNGSSFSFFSVSDYPFNLSIDLIYQNINLWFMATVAMPKNGWRSDILLSECVYT